MDNDGKTLVESKYANTANVEQYENIHTTYYGQILWLSVT